MTFELIRRARFEDGGLLTAGHLNAEAARVSAALAALKETALPVRLTGLQVAWVDKSRSHLEISPGRLVDAQGRLVELTAEVPPLEAKAGYVVLRVEQDEQPPHATLRTERVVVECGKNEVDEASQTALAVLLPSDEPSSSLRLCPLLPSEAAASGPHTRIVGLSWDHGGDGDVQDLRLTLSRRVALLARPAILRTDDGVRDLLRGQARNLAYDLGELALEPPAAGHRTARGGWVELELDGDFLLDARSRPVSAAHLGGQLPSGDGRPGGRFRSWFRQR